MGVLLSGWILVYVFEGAFYKTGDPIIYGVYPATAPFLIVGLAAAAWAAGRQDWPLTATCLGSGHRRRVRRADRAGLLLAGHGHRALPRDAGQRRLRVQAAAPQCCPAMTTDELDPLIHVPTRLKIVATLAALPDGDALSFTRLQDMIGLTPGNLIIHLRRLEEAGYLTSEKIRNGTAPKTTVALTGRGRDALGAYTKALRDLLGGL